jgi:hypothetical protein
MIRGNVDSLLKVIAALEKASHDGGRGVRRKISRSLSHIGHGT